MRRGGGRDCALESLAESAYKDDKTPFVVWHGLITTLQISFSVVVKSVYHVNQSSVWHIMEHQVWCDTLCSCHPLGNCNKNIADRWWIEWTTLIHIFHLQVWDKLFKLPMRADRNHPWNMWVKILCKIIFP